MEYFRILDLKKEPFSNTPDPEAFYQSREHASCLQKLEISIRLKRGLCVVLGEVGTGKTTLCRQIIRLFSQEGETEIHLILDPGFETQREFLAETTRLITGRSPGPEDEEFHMKEAIKKLPSSKRNRG